MLAKAIQCGRTTCAFLLCATLSGSVLADGRGESRTGSWQEVARMNFARAAHSLVVLDDGRTLAVGGGDANGYVNVGDIFDPHGGPDHSGSWTVTDTIGGDTPWGSNVPFAIKLNDGRVLLTGGITAVSDFSFFGGVPPDLRAFLFDPRHGGHWTQTGSLLVGMGSGVGGNAVVLRDGNVLIAGGYGTDADHNLIGTDIGMIYNVRSGTWDYTRDLRKHDHPQTRMPRGMTHNRLALMSDGRVLCIGGGGANANFIDDGSAINATIYDPSTGRWSAAREQMPEIDGEEINPPGLGGGRQWPIVVPFDDGRVLVAGGTTLDGVSDTDFPNPHTSIRTSALIFDGWSETWHVLKQGLQVSHAFSDTSFNFDGDTAFLLPAAANWTYLCGVGSPDSESFDIHREKFSELAPLPTAPLADQCDPTLLVPTISPAYGAARLMRDRRSIMAGGAIDLTDPNFGPSARTFIFTPPDR